MTGWRYSESSAFLHDSMSRYTPPSVHRMVIEFDRKGLSLRR